MKKALHRVLVIALALTMALGMVGTAFAAGTGTGYDPGTGTGSLTDPVYYPTGSTVTFEAGTGYDLTAKPGTSKNAEGDVLVSYVTGIIPENRIPGVTAADAYYEISGWAVKDKDGNLVPIDLKTYRFNTNTKVYAVVEDVWPVYKDMKQDRSDWYYLYVRDLSIAGVVNGVPGYLLQPSENVTWGMALKLVMLASGYEVQESTGDNWASGYLTKAREDALVPADQEIDLNGPITRLEIAELTVKALKLKEVSIKTPYIDTDAMPALQLYAVNIMEGSFNAKGERQFLPNNSITRAEIFTIVWRINNYTAE